MANLKKIDTENVTYSGLEILFRGMEIVSKVHFLSTNEKREMFGFEPIDRPDCKQPQSR